MANEFLRDRIARKLTALPDERLYQVLDFVEFLETKYAEESATEANLFHRFADGIEDRLRSGRVSATTIAETMNLMHKAMGVLNDVTAAGKSVASDIAGAASRAGAAAGAAAGTASSGSTAATSASPSPASATGGAGAPGATTPPPAANPPPASPPPASPPPNPSGDRPA